jgi:DNA-binding NarL/FixJ family response regulator
MNPTRVIVFDDSHDRRESLELLLNGRDGIQCIATFENCLNLIEDIRSSNPDVVLMDIDMPGMTGIEAVKVLKKNFPDLLVIMQTVFDDGARITAAISAGADGYILKKSSLAQIVKGIKEVIDGGAPMTPSVARHVLKIFQGKITPPPGEDYKLSDRETEMLGHLVYGLSYKMIADECGISQFTVNAHMRNIHKKLQVHSVAEAVSKALSQGLV